MTRVAHRLLVIVGTAFTIYSASVPGLAVFCRGHTRRVERAGMVVPFAACSASGLVRGG